MEEVKKRKGRPPKGTSEKVSLECTISDPLMEPYFILKDRHNFEVIKKKLPTRGFAGAPPSKKVKHVTIGYYTSFRHALNCIAKEKFYQNKGEFSSIADYLKSWVEVKDGLETLLNTIKV